jgi:hypothetical protein
MTISTYILPSTLFTPSGQLNFKVLEHRLLSPDLAPYDYHLFHQLTLQEDAILLVIKK